MLVTSKEIFKQAQMKRFAIPAMNFMNRSTLKVYVETAEKLQVPVIAQFAQAHNDVMDLEEAALLGRYYAEGSSTPVILHLDHGEDVEFVKRAVDLGFTSVMIDASKDSLEENIRKTNEVIEYAHQKGVVVEAEIGHVGSGENYEGQGVSKSIYTRVEDAVYFVEKTNVDSLAISIGTVHGEYVGTPNINFNRLREISSKINTPLVLHGGSSSGEENLVKCIEHGIVKINIFTDIINSAMKNISEFSGDYMELENFVEENMEKCVKHYFKLFRTNWHLNKDGRYT